MSSDVTKYKQKIYICPNCKSRNSFIAHWDDVQYDLEKNKYIHIMCIRCLNCHTEYGKEETITEDEYHNILKSKRLF